MNWSEEQGANRENREKAPMEGLTSQHAEAMSVAGKRPQTFSQTSIKISPLSVNICQ
jgi:hypothetical protein